MWQAAPSYLAHTPLAGIANKAWSLIRSERQEDHQVVDGAG